VKIIIYLNQNPEWKGVLFVCPVIQREGLKFLMELYGGPSADTTGKI
jgi:hypothetical protein